MVCQNQSSGLSGLCVHNGRGEEDDGGILEEKEKESESVDKSKFVTDF